MENQSGIFFHEFADKFDTFYDGKRNRVMRWMDWQFRRDMFVRYGRTFELLGDLENRSVLDIGCGSGPYMAEALNRGARLVTGIDPAQRMLDLARERLGNLGGLSRARFIRGYFPERRPEQRHDVAIVMGVMDYVADPRTFIRALHDRISSLAVLSFPSTHWFRTPIRRARYRLRNCPVWFYTDESIGRIMNDAGVSNYFVQKIEGAGLDYVVCILKNGSG